MFFFSVTGKPDNIVLRKTKGGTNYVQYIYNENHNHSELSEIPFNLKLDLV